MSNFLLQDIYTEKSGLTFREGQTIYKSALVPFRHCLAEPTPNEKLQEDTMFQVVDVRDTSQSTLSLIELITNLLDENEGFQDHSKNSSTNKKITAKQSRTTVNEIDVNKDDDDESDIAVNFSPLRRSIYRLTLQDCFGNICYAYEAEPLEFLRTSNTKSLFRVQLGCKLIVFRGARISFNTLHLSNKNVKFLGGYIKKLNYKLYERKLKELKDEIEYKG